MNQRKLNKEQIMSLVEKKQTMTWAEISIEMGIPVPTLRYYGQKLRRAGHKIKRQPSMKPVDLTIKS